MMLDGATCPGVTIFSWATSTRSRERSRLSQESTTFRKQPHRVRGPGLKYSSCIRAAALLMRLIAAVTLLKWVMGMFLPSGKAFSQFDWWIAIPYLVLPAYLLLETSGNGITPSKTKPLLQTEYSSQCRWLR